MFAYNVNNSVEEFHKNLTYIFVTYTLGEYVAFSRYSLHATCPRICPLHCAREYVLPGSLRMSGPCKTEPRHGPHGHISVIGWAWEVTLYLGYFKF